jgi:GNAT superfamily N-acetyltransferase
VTIIVRDLRPGDLADAEGFARVRRAAVPFMLANSESVAFDHAHAHPDAHWRPLVAEEDGEIVGTAQVRVEFESPRPGAGQANVYVHPDHRGRGAGSSIARAAERHLADKGVTTAYTWVFDEPANRAFAERRGYRPGRSAHFLRLDLAGGTLPPLQPAPPGVEIVPGTAFEGDPRPLFDLDAETTADEPSDVGAELADYDHWKARTWGHPLLDRALTCVAVTDGRPVAFTAAYTDGSTRYSTAMTGTARAYRGRGLAKLARNVSLHRARAAGITEAFTGNDTGNDAMLAINEWFGYEVCATEVRYVRTLG